MDNFQMPQIQPVQPGQVVGGPMPPVQPVQPAQPGQPDSTVPIKKSNEGLIKTIAIIALSLTTAAFIGLFVWMFIRYNDVNSDVTGQINDAVAAAKAEQARKDEAEFAEREKDPYRSFAGPVDYGQLSFQYPKTWSVYVAADAAKGGNFAAYFNPIQVNTVSNDTINALRVFIRTDSFESVTAEYQKYMAKNNNLSMSAITFNGITGNQYVGVLPNSNLNGMVVIFKIRDKTAILQTDSELFKGDFEKLLETVQFNA